MSPESPHSPGLGSPLSYGSRRSSRDSQSSFEESLPSAASLLVDPRWGLGPLFQGGVDPLNFELRQAVSQHSAGNHFLSQFK